ncbi:MAG: bis(5'-nucleosyl)-tetraphosphatase (symmetrical) YqeK [Oscillospiraceae bacterium]|nr:bis(5'-nucleosyl)-tetraphosphatase (symmetrical) YqeK [Oscillospiraceae bacterium]
MKIGIFGGTFNPPHIGHVLAAKSAAEENSLDLMIVIPTGIPPHKPLPPLTPSPDKRYQMTENAFSGIENIKVSDMEINSSEYCYTIDTVKRIQREYNGCDLYLLVGTDMYDSLDTWKDSDILKKSVAPVLLPRDVINISSSQIRQMLPLRKGREYLAEENYSYIIKNRLYGAKPDFNWLREKAHLMLNPLRIPHVKACETEAVRLAGRWGINPEDACEAAILHDITKKLDFSQNMCIIAEHGNNEISLERHEEKLLHSITGAMLAKSEFGVSDEVSDAIKWHTTGRAGMSMLEKVIYIADYIEATRDFPGVDNLRKAAYEDINRAMILGLEMTADDLKSRGITPNNSTYEALAELTK